jgi:hypothetical protein
MPLSQVIVAYCHKVVKTTGIALCVLDRAVNAVALARAFEDQGWGVLCMLDANEHDGLTSCEATLGDTCEDGTQVESGQWQAPRPDDPRHGVLVEPAAGKTLVSWGTAQIQAAVEATQWPRVSRERNERQDNSCKRMIDHGALHTNYGRTKIVGADRHQQRAHEQLDQALEAAHPRADKKAQAVQVHQAKVTESEAHGQGTRLEQRTRALVVLAKACQDAQHTHDTLAAHAAALGPPRERADRDCRTQTVMTVRPLLCENALTSCMAVLLGTRNSKVRLDGLLKILFARSGSRLETDSQVISWVNTAGVSGPSHRRLAVIVAGLGAMDLR